MKLYLPLALATLAVGAGAVFAAPALPPVSPAPAPTSVATAASTAAPAASNRIQPIDDFYAYTDWDDDDDDRRRYGHMARPDIGALRAAGFVEVTEVDRDDGRLEIEGYDAQGRKLDALMDVRGQRVIRVRHDRDDWDDRWDD